MIKTLNSPSDGQYNGKATTNEALLSRLRAGQGYEEAYDEAVEYLEKRIEGQK